MIPAPFDHEVAESVDHAIELLSRADAGEAKLLAGGHSLIPLMRLRLARPSLLVDVGRLSDLSYVRSDGDTVAIGALTRHHDLQRDETLQRRCPILSYTAGLVGDPQVRHRGTIGGSVAHSDPAADLPTVLLALEAGFVCRGPDGERTIPATEFFTGLFETRLGEAEVLTEIRVPALAEDQGWSYQKFHRRAQDWAVVGVAAVVTKADGGVGTARLALTNMGMTPLRATAAEDALAGVSAGELDEACAAAPDGTSPPEDVNASADFRRHLARVLTRRAVTEALSR